MDERQLMIREERPMTAELAALLGELATVLDDLALTIRDARAVACELVQELRHRVALRLYELADRLLATERR